MAQKMHLKPVLQFSKQRRMCISLEFDPRYFPNIRKEVME